MEDPQALAQVRAAIDEAVDAQNAGDAERLRAILWDRPGTVHIGTDADEWDTSQEFVDAMASQGDDDVRAVVDDLGVHAQGDVAWAEGHGRFTNSSGRERAIRMTAVLVRQDGRWRVAQSHASIGVPNEETFS